MSTQTSETARRLERTANGDQRAFEELYLRYKDFVFRLALTRCSCRDDALDIVQDTFVRLYRHAGTLRLRGRLESWLFKVVSNLCKDAARKRARHVHAYHPVRPASDPEKTAIETECWHKARVCLKGLSKAQKEAFFLRFFCGVSVAEIAESQGRSSASVRVHLCRAVRNIRQMLEPSETGLNELPRRD